MSDDAKSKALHEISAEYHAKRKAQLKTMHVEGKFVTGSKEKGKSIAQLKREKKEAWKNRHNDPKYKALSSYTTDTNHVTPSAPKKPDWAGDVHHAHLRNQKHSSKHYTEKGYREDYR